MSFDNIREGIERVQKVSIPLEQGSVFRPIYQTSIENKYYESQSLWNRAVSFDEFGVQLRHISKVSIPLEQGSVFRHITQATNVQDFLSQSLWNRAVSSDLLKQQMFKTS